LTKAFQALSGILLDAELAIPFSEINASIETKIKLGC
jgi:hypothetical protein